MHGVSNARSSQLEAKNFFFDFSVHVFHIVFVSMKYVKKKNENYKKTIYIKSVEWIEKKKTYFNWNISIAFLIGVLSKAMVHEHVW